MRGPVLTRRAVLGGALAVAAGMVPSRSDGATLAPVLPLAPLGAVPAQHSEWPQA